MLFHILFRLNLAQAAEGLELTQRLGWGGAAKKTPRRKPLLGQRTPRRRQGREAGCGPGSPSPRPRRPTRQPGVASRSVINQHDRARRGLVGSSSARGILALHLPRCRGRQLGAVGQHPRAGTLMSSSKVGGGPALWAGCPASPWGDLCHQDRQGCCLPEILEVKARSSSERELGRRRCWGLRRSHAGALIPH